MVCDWLMWELFGEDPEAPPADWTCPECGGDGVIAVAWGTPHPETGEWNSTTQSCPLCKGEGVYDEAFEALLELSPDALRAYAGSAWDAEPMEPLDWVK
ncbi:MAG: hypothetical protein NZ556_08030 [Fimbriimonadales bacterium]|nr:hypothetical protein [Fimbriimonadales bacterium]